jgi:hypothetical protein
MAKELEVEGWMQAERHITAAGFWGNFQWVLGGTSAVLAATASGTAFADYPDVAGVIALMAAAAAALVTALRPGDLSAQHQKSAAEYHGLQVEARDLWELDLSQDPEECRRQVRELGQRWSAVTAGSPRVPRRLYRKSASLAQGQGLSYFPKPAPESWADPPATTERRQSPLAWWLAGALALSLLALAAAAAEAWG